VQVTRATPGTDFSLLTSHFPPRCATQRWGDWRIQMRKNAGTDKLRPGTEHGGCCGRTNDETRMTKEARSSKPGMTKRPLAGEEDLTHAKSHQPSTFSQKAGTGRWRFAISRRTRSHAAAQKRKPVHRLTQMTQIPGVPICAIGAIWRAVERRQSSVGHETHLATIAPASSNRSNRQGNEAIGASGVEGHKVTRRACRP